VAEIEAFDAPPSGYCVDFLLERHFNTNEGLRNVSTTKAFRLKPSLLGKTPESSEPSGAEEPPDD
jgi:hypothetical protein